MKEEFKALGGIVIIVGTVVNEEGQPLRDTMQIQAQGVCAGLETDREGVAQIQLFIAKAMEHYAIKSVSAPSRAEAEAAKKPLIVPASVLANVSMKHGGN